MEGHPMKNPLLGELRKQLREAAPARPPAPAAAPEPEPEPEPQVDDATLFARATQGVQRLQAEPPPPPPRRRPDAATLHRRAVATAEEQDAVPVSDTAALLHAVAPEETLSFARNGIQARQLQKLRQGQLPWTAAVDLHGCTVDAAREAVLALLAEAERDGTQVVKIVHGKGLQHGQPLLKTCVNGWLRQLPAVLAFVSALPRDGGTGAVYVLLKRRRTVPD
jgi:DNA-nicking Smr family endonuclease